MNHLYIRTEANVNTAMGHMMRCTSIAESARKIGAEVTFIVAEEGSGKLPESKEFEVICLNKKWDDFENEIPVIKELIKERNIKMLLVDSYWVSVKYMEEVSRCTTLAYIDDLHERIWPVDILINYSVYSDCFNYEDEYNAKKLLLGTDYFPLRKEYIGIPKREISSDVKEVLIVSGGSDELHFMKRFAFRLSENEFFNNINFTFILGNFNDDYDSITEISNRVNNIKVLKTLPTLKDIMLTSDLIISAGGTTLYETAAVSLPVITYILADNQYYNATSFGKKKLALYAGDIREENTMNVLEEYLLEMINNKKLREEMSERLFNLLDGKGADRIAEKLCNYQ